MTSGRTRATFNISAPTGAPIVQVKANTTIRLITTFDNFNAAEEAVCVRINRLSRHRGVRHFFSLVSQLGDGWFWGGMSLVLVSARGTEVLPGILVLAAAAAVTIAA